MGKREEIHGIAMIPFGLLAGFADEKEIRITELAENGFCFRTVKKTGDIKQFRLCFYQELCEKKQEMPYREILISSYQMEETVSETSGIPIYQYSVFIEEETCRNCVNTLVLSYDRYIRLKLNCEDGELAEALTGYPAKKDAEFASSLEEAKRKWFGSCAAAENRNIKESSIETAVELDRPELYEQYQKMEVSAFWDWYWKKNQAEELGTQMQTPSRIYVGNAFCHHLFPEKEQLFSILQKAEREGLAVTVTCSYLREFMLDSVEKLLDELEVWCKTENFPVEIAANDWGMLELLRGRDGFLMPVFGTLLNKRKKDPRMIYKKGDIGLLKENSLNAEWYRTYLRDTFGITRYEWESCGYEQTFPEGKNSIHVPFYQTNTSQYCTLYAACRYGDRGTQKFPEPCPGYCREHVFLYPDHLNMVGRYNSLFALDTAACSGMQHPEMWKTQGIDRIVVDLL